MEWKRKAILLVLACLFLASAFAEIIPVKVNYSYQETAQNLTVTLQKENIDARIRIFDPDSVYFDEDIVGSGEIIKQISLGKGIYTMTVDDFEAKRQQIFSLNFSGAKIQGEEPLQSCDANICDSSETCSGNTRVSAEGICCYGECAAVLEQTPVLNMTTIPFILWAAVIILVGALLFLFGAIRGGPKKSAPKQKKVKKK
ncbi:MAG: hypothetical protein WC308_02685 [archaeon]|jgi:hypothetical protein